MDEKQAQHGVRVVPGLGGPGANAGVHVPKLSLPLRYMGLGLAGWLAFAAALVAQATRVAGGDVLGPAGVATVHLLTLGALLSFVQGAVYQLTTVAFLVPLAWQRGASWNVGLYGVSIAGLIVSMAVWWTPGLALFGAGATLAVCIYAVIELLTVHRSTVHGPMRWFVTAAHVYLLAAVSAALLLALAPTVGALNHWLLPLLATHILLAIGGFFTLLVMGFSLKLLPMFTLAHGYSEQWQARAWWAAQLALWLLLAGIWSGWRVLLMLGAAAGLAAFVCQALQVRDILRKRLRKRTEWPIRGALAAAAAGSLALLALLVQAGGAFGMAGWTAAVAFDLLGWVALSVLSYAYKIVPFLVWTARRSNQAKPVGGPLIAQLLPPAAARWPLTGFAVGLSLLAVSSACAWRTGALTGACLMAAALCGVCVQLAWVMMGRSWSQGGGQV
ncbi:MAG: hypothetical protein K6T26_03630 [Alicyclobacillus sp.]|nr:hypothetical protein [Alicyclobacillus sp.]